MIFWRRRYQDLARNLSDGWIFLQNHQRNPLIHNLPVIILIRIVCKQRFYIPGDHREIWILQLGNIPFITIPDRNIQIVILTLMINLEVFDQEREFLF